MRSSHTLDRIATAFDDEHLIADAGLLLPATLAQRELRRGHRPSPSAYQLNRDIAAGFDGGRS